MKKIKNVCYNVCANADVCRTEGKGAEKKSEINCFSMYKRIHFAHKSTCATGRCRCTARGKGGGWEVRCWAEQRWISCPNHFIHTPYSLITLWKKKNLDWTTTSVTLEGLDLSAAPGSFPTVLFSFCTLDTVQAGSEGSKEKAARTAINIYLLYGRNAAW